MNIRRWVFVTAPFILFTLYTYFASSSFPGAPEQMRWFVSIFLGFIVLLFLVQRALKDDNYFIPAMVMVLAVNFVVVHSVGMDQPFLGGCILSMFRMPICTDAHGAVICAHRHRYDSGRMGYQKID